MLSLFRPPRIFMLGFQKQRSHISPPFYFLSEHIKYYTFIIKAHFQFIFSIFLLRLLCNSLSTLFSSRDKDESVLQGKKHMEPRIIQNKFSIRCSTCAACEDLRHKHFLVLRKMSIRGRGGSKRQASGWRGEEKGP